MRVIHVLRKPLSEGTVAANTLKHGTGGLNIDASRIGVEERTYKGSGVSQMRYTDGRAGLTDGRGRDMEFSVSGRWPANVILQHLDGCRCDGVKRVGGTGTAVRHRGVKDTFLYGGRIGYLPVGTPDLGYADKDGKETVANWICEPGCPVARLDEQSGVTKSTGGRIGNAQGIYTNQGRTGWGTGHEAGDPGFGDTGGASRFYKQVGGKTDG
jgi:hypothetical protein